MALLPAATTLTSPASLNGYGSVSSSTLSLTTLDAPPTAPSVELVVHHDEMMMDGCDEPTSTSSSASSESDPEATNDAVLSTVFQPRALLKTLPLATIVFYSVSGGPFGSEASVKSAGVCYALLGFLVMPLFWSLPEAMVTAELGAAYPEASGGVAWVEEAFGKAAGWTEGYLKWVSGVTDNAIYPVLFLEYVLQVVNLRDKINSVTRFLLLSSTSLGLAYINWLGLEVVGNMSISICMFSMSPFFFLTLIGAFRIQPQRWFQRPQATFVPPYSDVGGGIFPSNRVGGILWRPFLNNLFWNLNSFDSAASFAGDVEDPHRVFPRAMFMSVIMVTASYFIPLLIATGASDATQEEWVDGYLATASTKIVGPWLGAWTVVAAGISNLALFQAEMSSDAFRLMGMADRGFMPKLFGTRSRWGTPTFAILLGTAVIVIMGLSDFASLTEMLNMNYSLALLMEYAAFIKLRISKPDLHRPYRVPLSTVGCVIWLIPTFCSTILVVLLASYRTYFYCLVTICLGTSVYLFRNRNQGVVYAKMNSDYSLVT